MSAPPQLYLPFACAGLNPHTAEVEAASLEWADGHGMITTRDQRSYYEATKLAWCMGLAYPDVTRVQLQLLTDFWTHICLWDDASEGSESVSELHAWNKSYYALLQGAQAGPGLPPIVRAAADLSRRFSKHAPTEWLVHFANSVRSLGEGFAWELVQRQSGGRFQLETYQQVGESTTGGHCMAELCCLVYGLTLKTRGGDPRVDRACSLAARLLLIQNDIFGIERDAEQDNMFNYVIQTGLPRREGLQRAVAIHDRWMQQLVALQVELGSAEGRDSDMYRLVTSLGRCLAAHDTWARRSARGGGWQVPQACTRHG